MHLTSTRRALVIGGVVTASLLLAACSPGSSNTGNTDFDFITEPFTTEDVAALGDVTLTLLLDAGEEATMKELVPEFEDAYPNVTVDITYKGWTDLMSTVVNSARGANPPDIFNAGSGYAVMPQLLKAELVRPLDDFVDAYGWDADLSPNVMSVHRWSADGTQYGSGDLYGIGVAPQYVGVFYNKAILDELGIDTPATIDDLETAFATSSAAGIQPIMVGNADKYPLGSHVLGALVSAFQSVDVTNAWLSGEAGATFDTEGVRQALETLVDWNAKGYLGTGFNGMNIDDAVSRFTNGEAAFFIANSFIGASIAEVDPDNFGFVAIQREDGSYGAPGGLGTSYRVSSRTELTPAVAAFLDMFKSPEFAQTLVDNGRLPLAGTDTVEAPNELIAEELVAASNILGSEGTTEQLDNASPTMEGLLGGLIQELLDGRVTIDEVIAQVQADWEAYQQERQS
jgi:raffinose/stachyose/melibiose transport system substrate-binding protein